MMAKAPRDEAVPMSDRLGCYFLLACQALVGVYLVYLVAAWLFSAACARVG